MGDADDGAEEMEPEGAGPNGEQELSPEEMAYLKSFQRVYVEDLGQDLLMDPNGNLYDLNGNIIGQAASDDEDESPAGGNGNVPLPETGTKPRQPPRRSHSP